MQRKGTISGVASLREQLGYITEEQVAGLLNISLQTFRNRQSTGSSPPFYRTGKSKLFRPDEVDAWIRRGRRG